MQHLFEIATPVASLLPDWSRPKLSALKKLKVETLSDLLCMRPMRYEDQKEILTAATVTPAGSYLNTEIQVASSVRFGRNNEHLKIVANDIYGGRNNGAVHLLCFGRNYFAGSLVPGSRFHIYGKATRNRYNGVVEISSFKLKKLSGPSANTTWRNIEDVLSVVPVYSLRSPLGQSDLISAVSRGLANAGEIANDLNPIIARSENLLPPGDAIRDLHCPKSMANAEQARRSLAALEFQQYVEVTLDVNAQATKDRSPEGARTNDSQPSSSVTSFIRSLPFDLTQGQNAALSQIIQAMHRARRKVMLQGDVGSGKTVVALCAMLEAISSGGQAALLCPTEILANQHYERLSAMLGKSNCKILAHLLTGSSDAKARSSVTSWLDTGGCGLIIGTHALLSDKVHFDSLKAVVIDEQHRFGVAQRAILASSFPNAFVIEVSATPIPRSLAGTLLGGEDLCEITDRPKGRLPIQTHLAGPKKRDAMFDFVKEELKNGHQAFFVCPRIDANDSTDIASVEDLFAETKERLPEFEGAVLHSRISAKDKAAVEAGFSSGRIKFLVATSMVEVGVDVPAATVIVIEKADYFGLASLHQLRGRVGRGASQGHCFLSFSSEPSEIAKERLLTIRDTQDGFAIAEKDLSLRGPGEILGGTAQSGFANLKFVDLSKDVPLLRHVASVVRGGL